MKFVNASSVEVESCIERAQELRKEFISQQLRLGFAALSRLIHGTRRAAASRINEASTTVKRDASMGMRTPQC